MWERYSYASDWCRLKSQINKEPEYYQYIGVLRHVGRPQKTQEEPKKLQTTYASSSETIFWGISEGGSFRRM